MKLPTTVATNQVNMALIRYTEMMLLVIGQRTIDVTPQQLTSNTRIAIMAAAPVATVASISRT